MRKVGEHVAGLRRHFPNRTDVEIAMAIAKVKVQEGKNTAYALYRLWALEQIGVLEEV